MPPMTPERLEKLKHILNSRQPDLTVLMDRVHKKHNLAAILRTCDAVGAMELHAVVPRGMYIGNPKAMAGSKRWVELKRHRSGEEGCSHLRQRGFQLIAAHADPQAKDFRDIDFTKPTALMMGSELTGMSDAMLAAADEHVFIPMHGMVQSLNVSVSAALILYEAERQRKLAGMYGERRIQDEVYARLLFEWAWPQIARYCREHDLPYPRMDLETAEILDTLPGTAGKRFK